MAHGRRKSLKTRAQAWRRSRWLCAAAYRASAGERIESTEGCETARTARQTIGEDSALSIQLKLYPPCPAGLEAVLGELHPLPDPWPNGTPVVIQITGSTMFAMFGFLKDTQVRFKVLDPDGEAREWSPSRHDWVESAWKD